MLVKHLIRYYLNAELLDVENMRFYAYKDLRVATQDFRPENKIGQGGFGSVYKVTFRFRNISVHVFKDY